MRTYFSWLRGRNVVLMQMVHVNKLTQCVGHVVLVKPKLIPLKLLSYFIWNPVTNHMLLTDAFEYLTALAELF